MRPLCTPTVATRPATCSGIREHADYTRHNGDTQTQICPRPTKDTRTASLLIASSIVNIFRVWVIMSKHTTWQTMVVFVLTDAVRCSRKRFELWVIITIVILYVLIASLSIHNIYECFATRVIQACMCWGWVGGGGRCPASFPVTYNKSAVLLFNYKNTVTSMWRHTADL